MLDTIQKVLSHFTILLTYAKFDLVKFSSIQPIKIQ